MLKLSKEQIEQKAALVQELTNAKATLETAVETYNDTINSAFRDLEEKVTEFNNVLETADAFIEGVVDEIRDHFKSMSPATREYIEGITYNVWLKAWEEMLDSPSLRDYTNYNAPEDVMMPDNEFDDFEGLPEEPE